MEPSDMETWTRNEEGTWRRWSHPGLGLDVLANASPRVVSFIVVGLGLDDDEQLFAVVRLACRLATGPLEVVAGIVHPSALWLESVRQAGADRAFLVPPPKNCRRLEKPPLDDVVELSDGICPELHVKHGEDVSLSVCGRHKDRMVLARQHFDRWCFGKKEQCPHWHGEPGG